MMKNTIRFTIPIFCVVLALAKLGKTPSEQHSTQIQAQSSVVNTSTKHQKVKSIMEEKQETLPEIQSISGGETDKEFSPEEIDRQLQSLDLLDCVRCGGKPVERNSAWDAWIACSNMECMQRGPLISHARGGIELAKLAWNEAQSNDKLTESRHSVQRLVVPQPAFLPRQDT